MAIGKRIKHFRIFRNLLQKDLGSLVGFSGKTTDVRIAQYESETRVPKDDMVEKLADVLKVSPDAITVPNIDTHKGILHTLFALEDMYGFQVSTNPNELSISLNMDNPAYNSLNDMLSAWQRQAIALENGEISKEEYDNWRYNYPESEAARTKKQLKTAKKK